MYSLSRLSGVTPYSLDDQTPPLSPRCRSDTVKHGVGKARAYLLDYATLDQEGVQKAISNKSPLVRLDWNKLFTPPENDEKHYLTRVGNLYFCGLEAQTDALLQKIKDSKKEKDPVSVARTFKDITPLNLPTEGLFEQLITTNNREIKPRLILNERWLFGARTLEFKNEASKISFNLHIHVDSDEAHTHCRFRLTNVNISIISTKRNPEQAYIIFQDTVGVEICRWTKEEDENHLQESQACESVITEKYPFTTPRSVEHQYTKGKGKSTTLGLEAGASNAGGTLTGKMDYQEGTNSSHVSSYSIGDFEIHCDELDAWEARLRHLNEADGGNDNYRGESSHAIISSVVKKKFWKPNKMKNPVQQAVGTFAAKEFAMTYQFPKEHQKVEPFYVVVYQFNRCINRRGHVESIQHAVRASISINLKTFEIHMSHPISEIKWFDEKGKDNGDPDIFPKPN